ncbi:MAG TPA: FHA domain-containing protein [Polyangiaceae bacterium]|nr:FHA domain-containing protein [Polyangiaceae bacterium]
MWKLIIEDEEGKRTVVPLTRDDYTIGRKEGNNIRLTERNVSRDHAALHRKKNGAPPPSPRTPIPQSPPANPTFFLEDHQSYNGVYVNGLRVAQTQDLLHGDLIQIGDYRIVLHDDAAVEQQQQNPTGTIPDDTKATLPNITTRGSLLLERPNRLVMLAGPTPGVEYPLDRDRLTIGRAEEAVISVNHNSVSRMHCEIHSLGEGRYEIVDKGSSNGVRVNGSDLRRGIIEAGDLIELGDVRFKFIGAGQIFLPGATDTHQFDAIGTRAATTSVPATRGLGVVSYLLIGMFLALAGAVGVWMYRGQRAPSASTGGAASSGEVLQAQPTSEPPAGAASGAASADPRDPDAQTLAPLANPATSGSKDGAHGAPAANTSEHEHSGHASGASSSSHSATSSKGPSTNTPGPSASAATPPPASSASVADQVRSIMLTDPEGAKKLLKPRVDKGTATRDEITLYKTICKDQHDQVCLAQAKTLLGEK